MGFLSREDRAFGGICWVFMRFFFLEYFSVLLAVFGMPSMMTWLDSDSDFSYSFFLRPPRRSPLVFDRKSFIFLLLSPLVSTFSFYLMIFSVFAVYTFPTDCRPALVFDDFKKELFFVEGSVGS
jgi:hypothetical protein